MRSRYGKSVMLVEVGMAWDQATASKAFLTDLITRSRNAGALGVLYSNLRPSTGRATARAPGTRTAVPPSRSMHSSRARRHRLRRRPRHHAAGKPHRVLRPGRHGRQQQCGLHRRGVREHQQRHDHGALARTPTWPATSPAWRFANGPTGNRPGRCASTASMVRRCIAGDGRVDHVHEFDFVSANLRAGANDIALVATTSGAWRHRFVDRHGSGISAVAATSARRISPESVRMNDPRAAP